MGKDRADFKATRELLGLTQQDIAYMAGVNLTTAKRWERPGFSEPPADVWDFMIDLAEVQAETVGTTVSAAVASGSESAQLSYYRNQAQYDALGRDPGPYMAANANARLVAQRLRALDVEVGFCYPDDPDSFGAATF